MWTERDIREQTDEQTFYRGKLLESTNGVLEFSSFETEGVYGDKELNLRATIHGTNKNNYKVEVTLPVILILAPIGITSVSFEKIIWRTAGHRLLLSL